jgi:hypothetical protein
MQQSHNVTAGLISEDVKKVGHNSVAYKAPGRSTMASAV